MMIRLSTVVAVVLITAIACFAGGAWLAYDEGQSDCQAAHDSEDLQLLSKQMQRLTAATNEANASNKAIQGYLAKLQGTDEKTTKELRNALKKSAAARANCRYDDDSMRIVNEARERAAKRAATGFDGAVPASGGSPGK